MRIAVSSNIISQLEFEAQAVNLKVIRNNLRHIFYEFETDKKIADDMVIAINEACMNIIQHAYAGDKIKAHNSEKILIIIEKNATQWRFELIDFATPVDIATIKAKDLNEVRPGGLGLNFINEIMDSVKYENILTENNVGNRLVLIKKIEMGGA